MEYFKAAEATNGKSLAHLRGHRNLGPDRLKCGLTPKGKPLSGPVVPCASCANEARREENIYPGRVICHTPDEPKNLDELRATINAANVTLHTATVEREARAELRDRFACAALSSLASYNARLEPETVAIACYEWADAMLAAREAKP